MYSSVLITKGLRSSYRVCYGISNSTFVVAHHGNVWIEECKCQQRVTANGTNRAKNDPENISSCSINQKTKDRGGNCRDDVH